MERDEIKQGLFKIGGFPCAIGCVDGTHVRIKVPSENEPDFVIAITMVGVSFSFCTGNIANCCIFHLSLNYGPSEINSYLSTFININNHVQPNDVKKNDKKGELLSFSTNINVARRSLIN